MASTYLALLIIGTIVIWFSGKRLIRIVDHISEETGLGKAFLGTVLLGVITSLPEISTTMIAASLGNAELATSNLIGGVSMQTSMLAIADAFFLKKALTFVAPNPSLLMGGVLLVIMISYVMIGTAMGEVFGLFSIGLLSLGSFLLYLLCLYLMKNYEKNKRWVPVDYPDEGEDNLQIQQTPFDSTPMSRVFLQLVIFAVLVFIGGSLVSFSAHRLTELTFLSSSFLGATFVAFATSLPELSTTVASVRLGAYTLGISNIFGSNLLMIGLIFFADIFYRDGLLLNQVQGSTLFLGGIGILVTSVYLWGLLERRNNTILTMGVDSFIVLTVHILGLWVLFNWN